MKHLISFIICIACSFVLYAGTPTSTEPVKSDKRAITLHVKPSRNDIHRAPSSNQTAFYGYYNEGVLYLDILDIVDEPTECVLTVSDIQIVTTAFELSQGIFIGDIGSCDIEIQIASFGILIGFID